MMMCIWIVAAVFACGTLLWFGYGMFLVHQTQRLMPVWYVDAMELMFLHFRHHCREVRGTMSWGEWRLEKQRLKAEQYIEFHKLDCMALWYCRREGVPLPLSYEQWDVMLEQQREHFRTLGV